MARERVCMHCFKITIRKDLEQVNEVGNQLVAGLLRELTTRRRASPRRPTQGQASEPFEGARGPGQFTHKIIHLQSRLPRHAADSCEGERCSGG